MLNFTSLGPIYSKVSVTRPNWENDLAASWDIKKPTTSKSYASLLNKTTRFSIYLHSNSPVGSPVSFPPHFRGTLEVRERMKKRSVKMSKENGKNER